MSLIRKFIINSQSKCHLAFVKEKIIYQNSLRNISDNPIFTKFSQIFIRFCHFSFAANLTAKLRQLWPQRQNKLFKRFALKQRTQEKSKQALSLWLLTCVGIYNMYVCVCVCVLKTVFNLLATSENAQLDSVKSKKSWK